MRRNSGRRAMYSLLTSSQLAACVEHGASPRSASSQRRKPNAICPGGSGWSRRWPAQRRATGSMAVLGGSRCPWPSSMKNPQALPSRSSTSEKVSGAVSHHCPRTPTAEGPSCRRAIASTVPHPAPEEARSTDNGCAPLGKNASRTTGLSIRYNMSAVNRHNSVAGASRDSPCNCLHAARRYCRYRSGLAPRRYPEMDSLTASCTTNPSRHASTNGRSTILPSNRSASTVSPSIATSNGPVTDGPRTRPRAPAASPGRPHPPGTAASAFHHPGERGVLERQLRMLRDTRSSQDQGERMPTSDPGQTIDRRRADSEPIQQCPGILRRERTQRYRAETRYREPPSHRTLTCGKDNCAAGRQQRNGETHENCPRNALRASRRNARVAVSVVGHEEWVVDDVSCRGHHEVRTVVPGRGQADEGPDTGRGGVRDRLVPGQRPASADQRGAEPAGGWTLGHDAATQAAGDQVLL